MKLLIKNGTVIRWNAHHRVEQLENHHVLIEDNRVLRSEVRRLVQSQPRLAFQIKPPPEAILFYRAATGLAHDLRLLKVRGRFRPILRDIQERGRLE